MHDPDPARCNVWVESTGNGAYLNDIFFYFNRFVINVRRGTHFFQGFGKFSGFGFYVLLLGTFHAFTFSSKSVGLLVSVLASFLERFI